MKAFDYVVVSIEGDEPKLVARALLPDGITEGTKLHYEYMEYVIVE